MERAQEVQSSFRPGVFPFSFLEGGKAFGKGGRGLILLYHLCRKGRGCGAQRERRQKRSARKGGESNNEGGEESLPRRVGGTLSPAA